MTAPKKPRPVPSAPPRVDRRRLLQLAPTALIASSGIFADPGGSRDVAWLAEVQRPPALLPEERIRLAPLMPAEVPDGKRVRREDWKQARQRLRQAWLGFLGRVDRPRQAPRFRVLDQERLGDVLRQRVSYSNGEGWPTEAYLLKPAHAKQPAPAVAVFHSTVSHSIRQPAGVEGKPEKAFALELAKRGCVAICPRNFLWPTNRRLEATQQTRAFHARHPDTKGMAKMLADAQIAVDILTALPSVDPERIGAVGHSLGAKEVLYLAAFDERIKVAVSSEGGIGIRFSNWDAPWYLGPSINEPEFDREHHEVLAMVAPRPFLLVGGDAADGDRSWPYLQAALPIYRLLDDTPRIGLLNHRQGHTVPPETAARIYEWFQAYL